MGLGEDLLVLHAQGHERVDVEEAAVVDLAPGRAPVGEPVVLPLEQRVDEGGLGVGLGHHRVDGLGHDGMFLHQPRERRAQHLFVAVPDADADAVGGRRVWEPRVGGGQEGELVGPAPGGSEREQAVERTRRQRQRVLAIADDERAAVALEGDLSAVEHPAVVVGQDGHEHPVAQPCFGWVPVDVEERRVAAGRAVLEHVPPPRVPAGDGHVVGDDVEHVPQAGVGERLHHSRVRGFPAQLLVDAAVVDDVVAVSTARRRLEVGRREDVADAQGGQVGGEGGGVVEAEAAVQLEAVGRGRLSQGGAARRPSVPRA